MLYRFLLNLSFCVVTLASTSPPPTPETRLIIAPPVIEPSASAVWVVGNKYNVTWDISQLPPLANITNDVGRIVLGQFNGDGEKLYLDSPLAVGFLITDSFHEVTCPDVDDGDYIIVLFGTASNASPQFKITRNPISSILGGASSTSSSSSVPSSSASGVSFTSTSLLGSQTQSSSRSVNSSETSSGTSSTVAPSGSAPSASSLSAPPLFSLSSSAPSTSGESKPSSTESASGAPIPSQTTSGAATFGARGVSWLTCAVAALTLSLI